MRRTERAALVLERLKQAYPNPFCALDHKNPFELMAATILSAQCTDERVNMVTPELFRRFGTPKKMAGASLEELEAIIRSTGFYRNKAKSLLGAATRIVETFGGEVPSTMEELLTLPGVARKTANVVLGNAFGENIGVVVDTHVGRLSRRIGLTKHDDPVKVEKDLMKVFPSAEWTNLSHRLIEHGRGVCAARWPDCEACVIGREGCRSFEPDVTKWKARDKRVRARAR